MAKFTERDEIEVALRYIARVRSMQPSAHVLDDLQRREAELKHRKRVLDETSAAAGGGISLISDTRLANARNTAGFG